MKNCDVDSKENQKAWDDLYRDTPGSVWGTDPIPFVTEMVSELGPAFPEGARYLDAATGEGRHLPTLLSLAGKVDVTDASPSALEMLARIKGEFGVTCCELEHLPFEDEAFDFVILIDTVETLPNPDQVLQEIRRTLKPGGLLLCNIPGREDGIAALEMERADNESYLYRGTYFYRFYDERQALELVRGNGFDVRKNEIRTWTEKPHPGFRDYEHSHTSRVFLLAKPL